MNWTNPYESKLHWYFTDLFVYVSVNYDNHGGVGTLSSSPTHTPHILPGTEQGLKGSVNTGEKNGSCLR